MNEFLTSKILIYILPFFVFIYLFIAHGPYSYARSTADSYSDPSANPLTNRGANSSANGSTNTYSNRSPTPAPIAFQQQRRHLLRPKRQLPHQPKRQQQHQHLLQPKHQHLLQQHSNGSADIYFKIRKFHKVVKSSINTSVFPGLQEVTRKFLL